MIGDVDGDRVDGVDAVDGADDVDSVDDGGGGLSLRYCPVWSRYTIGFSNLPPSLSQSLCVPPSHHTTTSSTTIYWEQQTNISTSQK